MTTMAIAGERRSVRKAMKYYRVYGVASYSFSYDRRRCKTPK